MKTHTLIHFVTCRRARAALLASLFPVLAAQAQGPPPSLRYDQVQQRLIHNAYSNAFAPKDEQLLDQLIHHRIRAVELDLMPEGYPCYTAGPPEGPPNWYIYHDCAEGHIRTTVNTLGDALDLFKAFHDAQPQHEVVTVYLELASNEGLKGSRSEFGSYSPDELDELLRGRLGDAALFTPANLLAWGGERPDATGSLHRVVSTVGWPTTDDLRGKFIFLIHGEENDKAQYFGTFPETTDLAQIYRRVAFYLDNSALWGTPGYSANPVSWAVVHSEIPSEAVPQLRRDLPGHILMSATTNDAAEVEALQQGGANLISTDTMDVEEHPFIRFYNARLYPFAASVPNPDGTFPAGVEAWTHPAVAQKAEPGRIFILGDRSGGDISGDYDEFVFAPLTLPPSDEPEIWTAEIASASNRRHSMFGKGFLMARASDAPDAPYCAVGRAADVFGLLMQYRSDYGLGTASALLDHILLGSGYRENKHFVRLDLIPQDDGQSTLCRFFGSLDGRNWVQFGDAYFPGIQLTERGFAVTSGPDLLGDLGDPFRAYTKIDFVSLERSVGGRPPQPLDLGFFDVQGIGGAQAAFALRSSQSAITCTDLVAQSEPGVCGAHVSLDRAIGDHGGTVRFSVAPDQLFPVGVTPVQATTPAGASCAFNVKVEDVERPVIQAAVAVPALSRIAGELVNVGLTASVTDNCAGVSAVEVAVSSDESDTEAGSNFSPDARDAVPGSLRLREERNSRSDGRVYLLLLKAMDTTGNAGWTSRTVVLPVSQSPAAADAVNAQAASARAHADATGAPPPGFVAVGGGPVLGPKQ